MLYLIMTDDSRDHIAGDEELLERYVLGTLGEDERLAVEHHIAGCDTCAAAVRRERLIAAGARRLGRDQLRNVLRQSARQPAGRPVVWQRVLSAAAVLGLIVGAGLYYDWLGTGNVPETSEQLRQYSAPEKGAKMESPPTGASPHGRDEGSGLVDARREPGRFAEAAPPPAGEKKSDRADTPAPLKAQGDLDAAQPAATGVSAGVLRDKEGKRAEASAPPTGIWTEGTPLSSVEEAAAAQAADKVSAESRVVRKEMDAKSKNANQLKAPANERQNSMAQYRVDQAPASALPRERQMVQQRKAGGGVQTLVTQEGSVTTMTLYLDSLVDPIEVKSANVEPVSDDSVIVNLGKQRIGYRLPAATNKEQQRPVK